MSLFNEHAAERSRRLLCLAGLVAAIGAVAGANDLEPRWSYSWGNWVPSSVSIGEEGSQVFTTAGTFNHDAHLFSSADQGQAAPAWTASEDGLVTRSVVASAPCTNMHAELSYRAPGVTQSPQPVLEMFSSSSAQADWSYTFPFEVGNWPAGVEFSEDGSTVATWIWKGLSLKTVLAVFTPGSSNPLSYTELTTWGEPVAFSMSADGSTLFVSSYARMFVYDVASASVVFEQLIGSTGSPASAMSQDGRLFAHAKANGETRVFERQGSSYVQVFSHQPNSNRWCRFLTMSADGGRLAASYDHTDTNLGVTLKVFDRASGSVEFHDTIIGQGIYDVATGDLAMSSDGEAIVLGTWGDELGFAPELTVYRLAGGQWSRVGERDLEGSVKDVALAHDGMSFAVASKAVHNNILETGGKVELYRLEGRDLLLNGVPSIGNTVTIEHMLPTGELSRVLWADSPQDPAMPFPGVGTLYVARNEAKVLGTATSNGQGVASIQHSIPNDPSLIGTTMYLQGLQAAPRRLSTDWVKMTILP